MKRRHRTGDGPTHDGDGLTSALLVGLATADYHLDAGFVLGEVLYVERDQLGPTKGAAEADQEQCAVAQVMFTITFVSFIGS